ncbi:MAG: flagellar hook capping FlgD N-terminal domain-containing protein [Planctomycetota bacterium]|jgi:flagellar basal-body rod modification protein FlgD
MSQITAFDPVQDALAGSSVNRFNEMSSEDFIRIMFTELSNQDPFQPNDSAALLEQLNSIRSIESDLTLVDKLESLVSENQLASAANLIGKTVSGLTADNERVTGRVVSVSRQGDDVHLELDSGFRLALDSVETIDLPNAAG